MTRKIAWAAALTAYLGSPLLAYFAIQYYIAESKAAGRLASGDAAVAIMIVAAIASALLSIVAAGLSITAFLRLAPPRPKIRLVEIVAFTLPLVVAFAWYLTL